MAKTEALFAGQSTPNGAIELYATDGTAAGTVLVSTTGFGSVFGFTGLGNGTAIFANGSPGNYQLYVTDGSAAGTTLLQTFISTPYEIGLSHIISSPAPTGFTPLSSSQIVFASGVDATGEELWATNGTAAGTVLLKDIDPGPAGSNPTDITSLGNGKALFAANDGTTGNELWVSDGTASGTMLVKDIDAGAASSNPNTITSLGNGTALFDATDPSGNPGLFISNGTASGTTELRAFSSQPTGFTILGNGKTLFEADDSATGKNGLWVTDGTAAGTSLVANLSAPSAPPSPPDILAFGNGQALFSAPTGNGAGLFITNGTAAGKSQLEQTSFQPIDLTLLGNGKAVFETYNPLTANGAALSVTDGTAAGTFQIVQTGYTVNDLTPLANGKAVFVTYDGTNGIDIWSTDGTAAGTGVIADLPNTLIPNSITALPNGKAVFTATSSVGTAAQLWTTDGTAAGTMQLGSVVPQNAYPSPFGVVTLNDTYVLPAPVNGTATVDLGSLELSVILAGGATLQFQPGTESVQLLDGVLSVGPDTNEAFLTRIYLGLFGTTPDPISLGLADQILLSGATQTAVANDFLATSAGLAQFGALSNNQFVTAVIQGLLGRTPSATDVNNFSVLLANGVSRGAVVAGIASSAESKAHFASATSNVYAEQPDAALVYQTYVTAFGSDPAVAGAQFATAELQVSGLSALGLAQQITTTPQFMASHGAQSNSDYVTSLYEAGLGRAPTAAQLAFDVNGLQSGAFTRALVLLQVGGSSEAAAHLTQPL